MIRSPTAASRAPAAPHAGAARPLTRPPARRTRQLSGDREQTQPSPDQGDHDRRNPESNACGHRQMQVRRVGARLLHADDRPHRVISAYGPAMAVAHYLRTAGQRLAGIARSPLRLIDLTCSTPLVSESDLG